MNNKGRQKVQAKSDKILLKQKIFALMQRKTK